MKSQNFQLVPEPTHPEPVPLLPELAKAAPYPIDQLPQVMRNAAQAIAYHVQAPVELAAQCVIGAAVYLAQSRINAPHLHRDDGMPASMFLLTLADSGDRKSECRRLAFKTIDEAEREVRLKHRSESEQITSFADGLKGKERNKYLLEHPIQPDPRTQFSDATFEPIAGAFIRGMASASWDTDEGGQMLGGSSLKADTRAATLGGLVKAFDDGTVERTRAGGNMEGSGFAYHRRLSIHLLAQPVTVREALTDPLLQGQGFLARFLFASPESLAGSRLLTAERMSETSYSDIRLQRFWSRCKEIQAAPQEIDHGTGEVKPAVMQMSDDAQDAWRSFYNETEREQATLGEYADIKPFAGRSGELVRRLAAVLAYFEGKAKIDTDIMKSACVIVRHSLSEWSRYMCSAKPDAKLQKAAALMDWLLTNQRQRFDARTLQREGPSFIRKSAKQRDTILSVLVEHRWLSTADGKTFNLSPSATTATFATTRTSSGLDGCDTVATRCDKTSATPSLSDSVAACRKPVASENPATTGLVVNVANVAAPIKFRGEI